MKKNIFTIENRNFGFFQNGLSKKWAKISSPLKKIDFLTTNFVLQLFGKF